MADERTTRLALPLLAAGQAQKEVTHNEALAALDLMVQASVVAVGRNDPPEAPIEGEAWIVGAAPTAAWSGRVGAIAGWTDGGWRFAAAVEGMAVWSAGDALVVRFTGNSWVKGSVRATALLVGGEQVVGGRRGGIAAPSGGGVVDVEARAAVQAVLDCLRGHGLIAS